MDNRVNNVHRTSGRRYQYQYIDTSKNGYHFELDLTKISLYDDHHINWCLNSFIDEKSVL